MLQGTVCQNKRTQALIDMYNKQFKLAPHRVDQIVDSLYCPDHLSAYHYKVVNRYTGETVECDSGIQASEIMHDMACDNAKASHAFPAITYQEGVEIAYSAYNSASGCVFTRFPLIESFRHYADMEVIR